MERNMKLNYLSVSAILYLILTTIALCQKQSLNNKISPFSNLGENISEIYSNENLIYHSAAIGLTYAFVKLGYDADILSSVSKMQGRTTNLVGHTGIFTGYLLPIVLPATMYLSSNQDDELRMASYAIMQSVGISVAIGTVLKAFTGRKPPKFDSTNKRELSENFQFGFLKGGIHYGWPSGHLMVNTALAATLASFYKDKNWVQYSCMGYVLFLTSSIVLHGEAHWFSEVVAGTLFGYAVGTVIGNNFRNNYRNENQPKTYSIMPTVQKDYYGFSFTFKL
jgi:membrane-associated phospholipid phosphatase